MEDVLWSIVEQAILQMKPRDEDAATLAEVLGALWAASVTQDRKMLRALRQPATAALKRGAKPIVPLPDEPYRSRSGYGAIRGDDVVRHVAERVGLHVLTDAQATENLTQIIADTDSTNLEPQVTLAVDALLYLRDRWLPSAERADVDRNVRERLREWLRAEKKETTSERRFRGKELLRELLVALGMKKKKAYNVVFAALAMRDKRGKRTEL